MQVRSLSAELPTYQSTIRAKIKDLGAQMEGRASGRRAADRTPSSRKWPRFVGDGKRTTLRPAGPRHRRAVSPFATAMLWLSPLLAPVATAGIVLVFVV